MTNHRGLWAITSFMFLICGLSGALGTLMTVPNDATQLAITLNFVMGLFTFLHWLSLGRRRGRIG